MDNPSKVIVGVKDILADDPEKQVWKFLRFYLDTGRVGNRIREIHGISNDQYSNNIKKQAEQIAYSIKQAEQYFEASANVGLATRPNLLYYGAVSLSRAVILLRNDGTFSYDALRKNNSHNHHGLEVDRGKLKNNNVHNVEEFLSRIQCSCLFKREAETGEWYPWGNFPLFYQSLIQGVFRVPIQEHVVGKHSHITRYHAQACADSKDIAKLNGLNFDLLTIFKQLPDMYFYLLELGVVPELSRGNVKATIWNTVKEEAEKTTVTNVKEVHDFFIDGLFQEQRDKLLKLYGEVNKDIKIVTDFGSNLHLRFEREYVPPKEFRVYFPDIVEDVHGKHFYITDIDTYLSELASILVGLYMLSMLSRYYPDIWVRAIEKNVSIAEITDTFLNMVQRKFPNLILDQLTEVKHHIYA